MGGDLLQRLMIPCSFHTCVVSCMPIYLSFILGGSVYMAGDLMDSFSDNVK